MPWYTVAERSFIGNALREVGDVVEFDGTPGPNLKPCGAPPATAPEAVPAYHDPQGEAAERIILGASGAPLPDWQAFDKAQLVEWVQRKFSVTLDDAKDLKALRAEVRKLMKEGQV